MFLCIHDYTYILIDAYCQICTCVNKSVFLCYAWKHIYCLDNMFSCINFRIDLIEIKIFRFTHINPYLVANELWGNQTD